MRPPIYFIRHGESTANQTNVIAGPIDSDLTDLGEAQAREAGQRIRQAGLTFDRVYASPLKRAWRTAEIAIDTAGLEDVELCPAEALEERDFGVYNGRNKSLVRKLDGYNTYEETMNSPFGELPGAESFTAMYERVAGYFDDELLPAADSGMRVLVVSHKYIVEMFALVAADLTPEAYFDIRVPNAKPLSESDLRRTVQRKSKWLKELSDRVEFHSTHLVALGALCGIMARLLLPWPLGNSSFLLISTILLALISFFVMVGINSHYVVAGLTLRAGYYRPWFLRIILSAILFLLFRSSPLSFLFLLAMMPPALASPVLSVLWGGEQVTAVRMTVMLSLLCIGLTIPAALIGDVAWPAILAFAIMFVLAFVLPSIVAQTWRVRHPIDAGIFALNWRWLSNLVLFAVALVSMYRFAPPSLQAVQQLPGGWSRFFVEGALVIGVLIILRLIGVLAVSGGRYSSPRTVDVYITHATPNIFLWLALVSGFDDILILGFWGGLAFFIGFWVDEQLFVWRERLRVGRS